MSALQRLSSDGRLTIPKDVLKELDLPPGTEFHVTVDNGRLLATPSIPRRSRNGTVMALAGVLGKLPTGDISSLQDVNEAIAQTVADDDERIRREWDTGRT